MPAPTHQTLTRRERQIMDILFRLGRATATEVMDALPGEPHLSTVRTQLRVLERKGHVRHQEEGLRYVYLPVVARTAARRSAVRHLIDTFFDGSTAQAVTALLGRDGNTLTEDELDELSTLIEKARKERTR